MIVGVSVVILSQMSWDAKCIKVRKNQVVCRTMHFGLFIMHKASLSAFHFSREDVHYFSSAVSVHCLVFFSRCIIIILVNLNVKLPSSHASTTKKESNLLLPCIMSTLWYYTWSGDVLSKVSCGHYSTGNDVLQQFVSIFQSLDSGWLQLAFHFRAGFCFLGSANLVSLLMHLLLCFSDVSVSSIVFFSISHFVCLEGKWSKGEILLDCFRRPNENKKREVLSRVHRTCSSRGNSLFAIASLKHCSVTCNLREKKVRREGQQQEQRHQCTRSKRRKWYSLLLNQQNRRALRRLTLPSESMSLFQRMHFRPNAVSARNLVPLILFSEAEKGDREMIFSLRNHKKDKIEWRIQLMSEEREENLEENDYTRELIWHSC